MKKHINFTPADWSGLIQPINQLAVQVDILSKNLLVLTEKLHEFEDRLKVIELAELRRQNLAKGRKKHQDK